jgi:hypothetical protein
VNDRIIVTRTGLENDKYVCAEIYLPRQENPPDGNSVVLTGI